jgi:hypothetical protein
MADTRINALTTAATTTSDDFLPIDGTTNGSKKLSAFSPTFGGNATVTGNLAVGGNVTTTGTATITGGIVGPVTVTGGVIGANSATIALRPNGVTSTSNQVTIDQDGYVTMINLEVFQYLGVYNTAVFYGGISSELPITGYQSVSAGTFLQLSNSTAPAADTGVAKIYVDTDGDLKVKFSNGVTKTLATDTA